MTDPRAPAVLRNALHIASEGGSAKAYVLRCAWPLYDDGLDALRERLAGAPAEDAERLILDELARLEAP